MKLSRSLDNFIENNVRPLALGRKNYLFCGNHDAAENAAIIYTFMGCCKLAHVNVRKWLNHFFTHIHDYDEDYSRTCWNSFRITSSRRVFSDIL